MSHRPFQRADMESADHILEWLMEVSNVAFYCDLSAVKRRLICETLVSWRKKAVREHVVAMNKDQERRRVALMQVVASCVGGLEDVIEPLRKLCAQDKPHNHDRLRRLQGIHQTLAGAYDAEVSADAGGGTGAE
jgi:hypothetical protein